MSFGSRILQIRKKKGMSQDELAKALKATPTAIGCYERDKVKPSIEITAKIANLLEVSLDYLAGNVTENPLKDKSMIECINKLLTINDGDRKNIINALDALIRDANARQAYS
jgi:transcriptional regulator with XRE-family HTH domain